MNQNFEMTTCQYCEAPTLDKTFTQEDCENCGYWLVYSTGEGSYQENINNNKGVKK
tara:strand:+ start:753 stop:920 length:168 start_codon:yes stop_codon:yes gene_type:complete